MIIFLFALPVSNKAWVKNTCSMAYYRT